jgi:hypothetical protein
LALLPVLSSRLGVIGVVALVGVVGVVGVGDIGVIGVVGGVSVVGVVGVVGVGDIGDIGDVGVIGGVRVVGVVRVTIANSANGRVMCSAFGGMREDIQVRLRWPWWAVARNDYVDVASVVRMVGDSDTFYFVDPVVFNLENLTLNDVV